MADSLKVHACWRVLLTAVFLLLGTAVSAEPVRVIAWLSGGSRESDGRLMVTLLGALKGHGWIEGRNLRFEPRFADGKLERWPALAALVRRGSRVTVLADESTWFVEGKYQEQITREASDLGLQVQYVKVGTKQDVADAYASLHADPPDAIVVLPTTIMWHLRDFVVAETAKLKVPSIYPFEAFADAGGLMTFAASLEESYRRAAWYVDRVLRGAKPADLPIEQVVGFRLVVNLGTARAQGITVPKSVLLRADRVIQ